MDKIPPFDKKLGESCQGKIWLEDLENLESLTTRPQQDPGTTSTDPDERPPDRQTFLET